MSNVPAPKLGPAGLVVPTEAAILAGVQADMQEAFGGGLNLSLETPQGQLASSLTAILGDANDQFLALANSVDPAYADGRWQDAIARIYFLTRYPAEPTVVTATIVGLAGTIIPAGAQAQATDGTLYAALTAGQIPSSGSLQLPFACAVNGPVACPAGSLTTIYQQVPGWDTVTNVTDGILGSALETRSAFEARRQASTAANAVGTLPALLGAVLNVPGVLDAFVTDNPTDSAMTIGGVSVPAHSLYASVAGGAPLDVATAIWSKKAPGCGYGGNTTVNVVDRRSGYVAPYPTYPVTFETPTPTPVLFAVGIAAGPQVPSDAAAQIQAAIIAAFAGADGGPRARIGSTIYALRFAQAVTGLGAWAQLVSLAIGTDVASQTSVTMRLDQAPTVSAANITVTVA